MIIEMAETLSHDRSSTTLNLSEREARYSNNTTHDGGEDCATSPRWSNFCETERTEARYSDRQYHEQPHSEARFSGRQYYEEDARPRLSHQVIQDNELSGPSTIQISRKSLDVASEWERATEQTNSWTVTSTSTETTRSYSQARHPVDVGTYHDSTTQDVLDEILDALRDACRTAYQAIPATQELIKRIRRRSIFMDPSGESLKSLSNRCDECFQVQERLTVEIVALRGDGVDAAWHTPVWRTAKHFMHAYLEFMNSIRDEKALKASKKDIVSILHPLHKRLSHAGKLIDKSPWKKLADQKHDSQP